MKSLLVSVPELLKKVQEMSNDDMQYVKISFVNESMDQSVFCPGFLHFEAFSNEGDASDYESIDRVDYCYIDKSSPDMNVKEA